MDAAQARELVELSRQVLSRVVEYVCGACERNCCHQGTMMGSQDLRRLVRAARVDSELAQRLREGLRERAEEILADVEAARRALAALRAAGIAEDAKIALAEARADDLEKLARDMQGIGEISYASLSPLLLHTALRANLVRAFRNLPGGEAALVRFAGPGSSFKYRGKKIAPPRCIFHSEQRGCLAGEFKPAKCANFFCTADPSLLDAIRERMDFDDFVLANLRPAPLDWVLKMLRAELELGPEYHEPMVVIGLDWQAAQELADELGKAGARVGVRQGASPLLLMAADIQKLGDEVPEGEALVYWAQSADGAALYEMAIGFDRLRLEGRSRMIVVAIEQLADRSALPHPLWDEQTIAQPIGYLECYLLEDAASDSRQREEQAE